MQYSVELGPAIESSLISIGEHCRQGDPESHSLILDARSARARFRTGIATDFARALQNRSEDLEKERQLEDEICRCRMMGFWRVGAKYRGGKSGRG